MSDFWTLEEVDVDGAAREAAEKVDPNTRAAFLKKAGLGVGAVAASSAFFGGIPALASAAVPASDVAILKFALTLEYLEATFYTEAVSNGNLTGETAKFAEVVKTHENVHVAFLKKALGSAAPKKPKFDFKDTVTNQAKFQATSIALEDTGVQAYLGQTPKIKSKKVLAAAGSILPVEARHAAWIRDIELRATSSSSGSNPAPHSFDKPQTKAQILAKVQATGFIVG